jgi:hypothetical protein
MPGTSLERQSSVTKAIQLSAGPSYFEDAVKQVSEGIESMAAEIAKRSAAPYSSTKME